MGDVLDRRRGRGGLLEGSCWAPLQENTGVKTSAREVEQKSRIGGKIKK